MNLFASWWERLIVVFTIFFILVPTIGFCDASEKRWKILHVMSYHSPWKWTDDQLNGFKRAFHDQLVEYKVIQMDGKRSSQKAVSEAASEARQLIESWSPDLVYTTDDLVQKHLVKHYINSEIPFVFSGVNLNPIQYGYLGSKNITGVMEQEHFVETVSLLKKTVPTVNKIAVIFDDSPTWEGVGGRMLSKLPQIKNVQVTSWNIIRTFDEYKKKILDLQDEVDAIALLGIFTYKDQQGNNVPYTEVLKWTSENSRLPDFSFWKDRISYGTLCTVTVSGYEQGRAAGKIARKILVDGVPPSAITMRPTIKGEPVISLARATKLGIAVDAKVLLSSDVVETFKWDE